MLKLSEVVNAFSKINEDVDVYLNKNTGKSLVIYDNDKNSAQAFKEIETNFDSYIILPDCKAIDSKSIMAKFIDTIDNDLIKYELITVLNSSDKPCAKFMDTLFHFGLRDTWSDFKYDEMIDLSIKFLNFYQLDFEDDLTQDKNAFIIEVVKTVSKVYRIKADTESQALKELNQVLANDNLNTYEVLETKKILK